MKKKNDLSITAIAKKCGVSAMTVSRALRGNDAVKEETRKKVLDAAESMGYIRNPLMGRPSRRGEKGTTNVEIIIGTTGRGIAVFHSQLLSTLEQQLAREGYDCIVRTCNGEYEQFMQLLENVRSTEAVATLLIGSFAIDQLGSLIDAVPGALLIDNPGDSNIKHIYESFCFDNYEAAKIALNHLFECGCKKILLVNGSKGHFFTREIELGYREALDSEGIDINKKLMVNTDFTSESAHEKVSELLNIGVKFDAVFTNDEMASGVYRALLERNFKIPDDVCVVGCDGLPVGKHLFPQLSTVKLDYEELARRAIRHILHERKLSSGACRIRLLPQLEVRESSVK